MGEWKVMAQRFDYDLWANAQWLETLERKGRVSPDIDIFSHILSAQSIWLQRCHGTSPSSMPVVPANLPPAEELVAGWKEVVALAQDRIVSFRRTNGQELELSVSKIVWHVLNHGTYHRGELRGLCRARGDEDFPESDLGAFFFTAEK